VRRENSSLSVDDDNDDDAVMLITTRLVMILKDDGDANGDIMVVLKIIMTMLVSEL